MSMQSSRIVCIGGGTGQSILLSGLKRYSGDLTAIVTVTDSGRSTGKLRRDFDIPAVGDIRNCLVSLSGSPRLMQELFQYRFEKGEGLEGMSFGNLFLTAMTGLKGNIDEAIREVSRILKIQGKVLPSTLENIHLKAKLVDGSQLEEEVAIVAKTRGNIESVFLSQSAGTYEEVVDEISRADLIILGPGSLYTSIIANLLVDGIPEAIGRSNAAKVFVNNIMTQPGQTEAYDTVRHVTELIKYLGEGVLDFVVLNTSKPPADVLDRYAKQNSHFLECREEAVEKLGVKVITADLIEKEFRESFEWNKADYIRHDAEKLSNLLISLVRPEIKGVILVAGKGTRMKPFTLHTSKEMFRILGKPLIAHHVDEFVKNNINDIVFVCNENNHQLIKDYFVEHYPKQSFTFAVQHEQLGPAHALLSARDCLQDCMFILKYGDSLSENDQIKILLERFNKQPSVDAIVTLRRVKDPREYGIARFAGERLVEIVEKPQADFPSDLANVGLCMLKGAPFFAALEERGYRQVIPPPQYILAENGIADFWIMTGKRVDVGRVWNILEATRMLARKLGPEVSSRSIHPSAKIGPNVNVTREAEIGEGVELKGYSSISGRIGKNTVINNSVVQIDAVVGENCNISSSVIDRRVRIGRNFRTKTLSGEEIKIFVKDRYVNTDLKKVGVFIAQGAHIGANITSDPGRMVYPMRTVQKDIKNDLLVRAVLLDADNTLYRTKKVSRRADMAVMRFFAEQCGDSAAALYEEWQAIVARVVDSRKIEERSRRFSYARLVEAKGIGGVDEAFQVFVAEVVANIEIMPDILEYLPQIHHYKMAVFTEDHQELAYAKLSKFKLTSVMDSIITCNDVGVMKPSMKYYELALQQLDASPLEAVAVGDNYDKDLALAKELGMTTILFGSRNEQADFCIDNYQQLIEVLQDL